jgi:PAS domain S-box-containing protein
MGKIDSFVSTQSGFKNLSAPALLTSLLAFFPAGGSLPADVWQSRHRFLLRLTWLHGLLIALIGPMLGYEWEVSLEALFRDATVLHTAAEGLVVVFFAGIAAWGTIPRVLRSTAVGFGLVSASAIFVHLSGGYIELHFHFFVVLAFLALYQDWVSYLLAIVYVAVHHGIVGVMWPQEVYNHTAALNAPWTWAAIHAFFVLCAAVGSVIAWRFNEKAFAQSKLILDSAGEGIYGLDRDGKITFMNPAAASLLQWEPKQAIGKLMLEVLRHTRADSSDFSDRSSPILASLTDGIRREATNELFSRKNGDSFPVEYLSTPIVDRGELTGAVITFRDVTERSQAEQALRSSEERFRALAETANDAIVSADSQGNIIYFNEAAERTFKYFASDAIGRPLTLLIPERFRNAHRQGMARFLSTRDPRVIGKTVELVGLRKDGTEFPLELSLAAWQSNRETFFTAIIRDVTQRKHAEELQNRYQELAIVHDTSQMILKSADLRAVLEKILDQALSVLSLDLGNIRLFDSNGHVRMGVYRGYRDPENVAKHHGNLTGTEGSVLVPRVIASGKSLAVEDVTTTEGLRTFKKEGARSAVVVPITTQAETLGVIEVGGRRPCSFRPDDIRLLEAIGNQIGIAAQKARLLEETEGRAQEQGALNIIAKAISQSLRRDELLQIALDKVLEVTGRERVSIRLKDFATGRVTLAAHRGFSPEEIEELLHRVHHSPTEQVLASGQPLVINNSAENRNAQSLLPQSRSVAWIPMKAGSKVVGILGISASSLVSFSQREVEFLQAIGNMIGVALENARLFGETQARYRELQTLHTISGTILDSLDLRVMMERILDQLFEIGTFDIAVIRLLDPTGETLEPVASRGFRHPQNVNGLRTSTRDRSTARLVAQVIATKECKVADLTTLDGTRMRTFRREEVKAVVAVPLRTQRDALGVIHLGHRSPREYAESELRILDAVGSQVGIAIQKARLYEETKRAQAALAGKAEELARSNIELQHSAEEIKFAKEKLEKVNSVLTLQAAELARSNTELEQFAYIASHDLQEPLRMVASYVQLLARRYKGKLDADADEFIGFAVDGSKRMQELINALLAYSRIGTKGRDFAPIECESVLKATLQNLQIAIEDSQAVVTHDPLPTVRGDATQLGQLFQNLIGNAIKFRGDRRPAVHVSAARNGNAWLFSVRDDGIGIDPQYSERIFVIFQRLHSKEEYPGTGIGLALCKKIVERHGGRIWVESEPGKGATFSFTMPG